MIPESNNFLNYFGNAVKSDITPDISTLSDWYSTTILSSGTRIFRRYFQIDDELMSCDTGLDFKTFFSLRKCTFDKVSCKFCSV